MDEERTYDKEKEVNSSLISREKDIVKGNKETTEMITENIKRRKNIKMTGKTNIFKILFLG